MCLALFAQLSTVVVLMLTTKHLVIAAGESFMHETS